MKKIAFVSSFILLFFIFAQNAVIYAEEFDWIVTGTGQPEKDISKVQKVVDQGGSILLKGVFNFGQRGKVVIRNDVRIYGERDYQGMPATKIIGGSWTFHTILPAELPPVQPGPKISIQRIHFTGALWTPIYLPYCSGAEIRNNKVTNVQPIDIKMRYFGKDGIHRQQGVIFYPPYTLPKKHGNYLPGLITGTILVSDNIIDLDNMYPENTVGQGILIFGTTGATIKVLNNQILNASRNAIEVIDNYAGEDEKARVIVHKNKIITGEKGLSLPSPSTPNGIIAGWFLNLNGALNPEVNPSILVSENDIEINGETSIGILVISDGVTIASNTIRSGGGKNGKAILHFNSNANINGNKILGAGLSGILLTPWKEFKGDQNIIINNDFSKFNAIGANIILRGTKNLVIGNSMDVSDNTKSNLILQ